MIPCGAVAKFSTGHREARGSIPRRVLIFSLSQFSVLVSQCFLIYLLIISLACIIHSDPRTHCLVFRNVLRLAKVNLIGHPQIFLK